MSNKTNSDFVPRLRFPEFQTSGSWQIKPLSKISYLLKDKAGSRKLIPLSVTAGVGLVSQIEKFGREIAGTQYKNYYVIKHHDFAYNKSATKEYPQGFIAMYLGSEDAAVPNSIFTCFRVFPDVSYPPYLNYLFFNNQHGKWLGKFITVGARAHGSLNIDDRDLLATPLPFPPKEVRLAEQKKIADCLSSLDEVIEAQTQKLEILKKHKKALMSRLFPVADAGGGVIPRLRFPEFKDAGDWKMRKFSDILIEHGYKSTSSEDVFSVSVHKGLVNQIEHLGRSFSAASILYYNRVLPGDVVYTKSPTGSFPLGIIKQSKRDCDVIVSPLYGVFSPETIALGTILDAYFTSPTKTHAYLEPLVQKGAKNTINISNERFLSGELVLPSNKEEQQKIADCLSSLDEVIEAKNKKIIALKNHKKSLISRLFPKM